MSTPGQEFVEVFLTEASEHLQFLREYSGILMDPYPMPEDVERLYISAHTLEGTSASYGYPLFSEVSAKLAHIFQYAMNATIGPEASGPLVEFISEGVAVLESDLIMVSANNVEAEEDINSFKIKYPFAFQAPAPPAHEEPAAAPIIHVEHQPEPVLDSQELGHVPVEIPPVASQQMGHPREIHIEPLEADGEVPAEILEFFVPEAEEHLQIVQDCLLALEANPNAEDINRLFRAIHTVKGSAAQVGLQRIARVAHRAEDLVGRLRDGLLHPSAEIVDICLESVDALKKFLYNQWADEATMQAAVNSLLTRIARLAPEEVEGETHISKQRGRDALTTAGEDAGATKSSEDVGTPVLEQEQAISEEFSVAASSADFVARMAVPAEPKEDEATGGVAAAKRDITAVAQSKSVRIALERLDRMMNAVGELVINRTRMLGRLAELERLADVLNFSKGRMADKVTEFQEKYEFSRLTSPQAQQYPSQSYMGGGEFPFRGGFSSYSGGYDSSLAEFSELEMDRYDDFSILSRSLTEISADISEVLTQLDGFVRRVDSDIDEFTKLAHRLQDEITQARMVPIGNLYARLSRTVRDAAKAANKQVELTLAGAETELDNNIIQQISDPLIHLVRNSVAHGLERHDERYHTGKSDHGNVAVRAYHRGNHIFIEVEDDGRGIDYEKVKQTAIAAGLVHEEDAANLAERDLLEFLFHPGFSTAPRKTELAGRGVGLDVVRANLSSLNGEIEIETSKGHGTRFTLKVPLTLIISQALFVRNGKHTFAMPLSFVEEIRRLKESDIEEVGGKLLTKVRDVVTEIVRLDTQLGLEQVEPVNGYYRMVIANVAGRQVGIVVEEVLRKDEIVIKSLGEYLRNVKMFPGSTIAPDGSLILLIDVNRLVVGESIEHRPLMTSGMAARIFAPGAVAVATGAIPVAAIDVVEDEKVVVLADDSISVRKFVGRMLEKAGYRVKLASDGLEALEIATQMKCDLVVTDLEMPRTNGYELISHLRQNPQTRNIPVMVVTSRAGAKHRDRAMKEGAAAFMTKPVQDDQFIAAIVQLIGHGTGQRSIQVDAAQVTH
ncbi:MAG: putative Chemotaxis protein CheA modulated with response regulator receiver region (Modular protein) [Candidatus Angelobacter sp.]|nr:putative Chemotaxis protein CheA modulated with response regulator receiver region (Modular protein) [Candidatus Angelobacter sp.]